MFKITYLLGSFAFYTVLNCTMETFAFYYTIIQLKRLPSYNTIVQWKRLLSYNTIMQWKCLPSIIQYCSGNIAVKTFAIYTIVHWKRLSYIQLRSGNACLPHKCA